MFYEPTPEEYSSVILGQAFSTGHGREYNRASHALRQEHGWLFYEVVLTPGQPWTEVRDQVFPPLGRFLGRKKLAGSLGAGLVVTVFLGEHYYLIAAPDLLAAYCELEALAPEALPDQIRRWIENEGPVYPLVR
jgi:hypothetical protein